MSDPDPSKTPSRELRLTDAGDGRYKVEQFDSQGRFVMERGPWNRAQVEYLRFELGPCRVVMPDGSHE